jgi:uncharacterized membrane protein
VSAIHGGTGGTGVDLEVGLARVLQIGSYASIGLVAVGTWLLVAGGVSPLDPGPPLDVSSLVGDVFALRPAGLLWLGILGIVATPGARVVGALVGFARRGERTMVLVAAAIIVVVAAGVVAGLVTG